MGSYPPSLPAGCRFVSVSVGYGDYPRIYEKSCNAKGKGKGDIYLYISVVEKERAMERAKDPLAMKEAHKHKAILLSSSLKGTQTGVK